MSDPGQNQVPTPRNSLLCGAGQAVVAAWQLDHLAIPGVNRFELGDREDGVAVATLAGLAVDGVEVLDGYLGFLSAGRADD